MSSFDALPPQPITGASGVPQSRVKATRHKLPPAASKILKDFVNQPGFAQINPTGTPSLEIRKYLLAEIKKIPGAEFYQIQNVNNWFRYRKIHQKEQSDGASTVPAATSSSHNPAWSRYHSLSETAIKALSTLCKDTPNPSLDTLAIWAKFIAHETPGATFKDVTQFVYDCQNRPANYLNRSASEGVEDDDIETNGGLPTPGNTASPAVVPSSLRWTTPDTDNVKTRESQSPMMSPSTLRPSIPASTSASTIESDPSRSVSPHHDDVPLREETPERASAAPPDDMDCERYTPVSERMRPSDQQRRTTETYTIEQNQCSPPPRLPSCTPSQSLDVEEDLDEDMDISPSPSPAIATVDLPVPEDADLTPANSTATGGTDSVLEGILRGLASIRDNTVPVASEPCPTNQAEFDAAFARFDSTCSMLRTMLDTREAEDAQASLP